MNDALITPIPADDPNRTLTVADPDSPQVRHLSIAAGTYTILVSGAQTDGRYCLIDMLVPDGGGPGPHRHDFEEMYTILEGEVEFSFRGKKAVKQAGTTLNIPANAPHFFRNKSGRIARLLCMCAPAGQEEFFMAIGEPLESRTALAPPPTPEQKSEFLKKSAALAPRYRTELLQP